MAAGKVNAINAGRLRLKSFRMYSTKQNRQMEKGILEYNTKLGEEERQYTQTRVGGTYDPKLNWTLFDPDTLTFRSGAVHGWAGGRGPSFLTGPQFCHRYM